MNFNNIYQRANSKFCPDESRVDKVQSESAANLQVNEECKFNPKLFAMTEEEEGVDGFTNCVIVTRRPRVTSIKGAVWLAVVQ